MRPTHSSFTATANGLLRVLQSPCRICPAFDPSTHQGTPPILTEVNAIWDTGASCSAISEAAAVKAGLIAHSMTRVFHAGGEHMTPVYQVNITLPNGVNFFNLNVTQATLNGADMLIGMDIIGSGDFAVTNAGGVTVFSYRCPSVEPIDFVKITQDFQKPTAPLMIAGQSVGRNSQCPCHSGKKFKQCCGKR